VTGALEEDPSRPPVTVAVVSWNTRDLLSNCLRSLRPEVEAGRASVWVVDNGSSDDSPQLVRREAPWAQLIAVEENLGFGRAVDLVAQRTTSTWLAPANADVALTPGALPALLAAGDDPLTAAVAPRLLLPDGRTQHSVYSFPTLPFTLAFNLGVHRLSRRLGDRLCLEGYWDPDRPRTVDWAIGAFLLVRRSAFEAGGGFDAAQWMYAEDLDLCWRLARAGYSIRYEPQAVVRHHGGAATSAAFGDAKAERFMAATYAVLARRRGRVHARALAALNCAGAAARLAWAAPLARFHPRWRQMRDLNRMWLRAHRQGLRPEPDRRARILPEAPWPSS
jgi:N-acetylglucosaminyl-diphospho-decaprenol L-rhamnosyltransferase